jgi:hypothetical protein
MAGYSPNPLLKKLGIKEHFKIQVFNAPDNYWEDLGPLPANVEGVEKADEEEIDFIHFFTKSADEMKREIGTLKASLKKTGMLWISWPKKASKVPTDMSDGIVRSTGLDAGLVDVKVCAVDDVWSGLKFMYRIKDR